MRKAICWMVIGVALTALAAPKKAIVCKTCHDTGKVAALCPLCRGSKWMWTCQPKGDGKGWATYEVLSNDGDGVKTTEGWCGYGASYRALHKRCPNVRKRQACPQCAAEGRPVSTGRVRVACPDCDGEGHVRAVWYLIPDAAAVKADLTADPDGWTSERVGKLVARKKLTSGELDDFKSEHPQCRTFSRLAELLKYFKAVENGRLEDEKETKPAATSATVAAVAAKEPPAVVSRPTVSAAPPLTDAVRRLIEIEEAHEREMFKRKFGDLR